jgi:hypothetical protein
MALKLPDVRRGYRSASSWDRNDQHVRLVVAASSSIVIGHASPRRRDSELIPISASRCATASWSSATTFRNPRLAPDRARRLYPATDCRRWVGFHFGAVPDSQHAKWWKGLPSCIPLNGARSSVGTAANFEAHGWFLAVVRFPSWAEILWVRMRVRTFP